MAYIKLLWQLKSGEQLSIWFFKYRPWPP